jgi:ABC-2 type transport system permease protein
MLLFGMSAAALGFSELFFNHIWMVPGYVITGDLDRLLTYPVNSLFFLLITRPELHSFGNLTTGLVLASISLYRTHAPWHTWVLVPLLMLLGCVIYTGALVIMTSISFKFIGPSSMHLMIPNTMLQASGYPLSIFPGGIQIFLMFLLPYGAFQFTPASVIFGKVFDPWFLAAAPLAVLFFLWNVGRAWRWGIDQYESTGS